MKKIIKKMIKLTKQNNLIWDEYTANRYGFHIETRSPYTVTIEKDNDKFKLILDNIELPGTQKQLQKLFDAIKNKDISEKIKDKKKDIRRFLCALNGYKI